jgi:xylitol oxidase
MVSTWSDSYVFQAPRVARPTSLAELQQLVAGADRVRALGSRHSFTALADTDGLLVDMTDCTAAPELDLVRREVTVAGGVTLGALASALAEQGWALPTLPSLPHITVAGAVATGTHGSGERVGSLAAGVSALEVVGASGELRRVRRGDSDFEGQVVALGALGVVHRVTLDVEPAYTVRQQVRTGLAWTEFADELEEVLASGYSVSAFTDWVEEDVSQLWVKTRTDHDVRPVRGNPAASTLHMIPGGSVEAVTEQQGREGPWHERLPHFRAAFTPSSGVELQSEYFVHRERAHEAIHRLRRIGPAFRHLLQVSEIRTVAADRLWLSGAYEAQVVALHFTWHRQWDAVHEALRPIEDALLPLGARPHWGKCFVAEEADLAPLYPRFEHFRRLRAELDPEDCFGNAFLDRVLGPR